MIVSIGCIISNFFDHWLFWSIRVMAHSKECVIQAFEKLQSNIRGETCNNQWIYSKISDFERIFGLGSIVKSPVYFEFGVKNPTFDWLIFRWTHHNERAWNCPQVIGSKSNWHRASTFDKSRKMIFY